MLTARGLMRQVRGADGVVRTILAPSDLEVGAGECVAITGESGTGKSTLLNLLAGLDRPDGGTLTFDGNDLLALDDDARTRWRAAQVGFVFQAFHLLPWLTVLENVRVPLRLTGQFGRDAEAAALGALDAVAMTARAGDLASGLSGGEAQRVAVARALVHRPRLVLADEPTGNLDPENAGRVLRLLRELASGRGASLLLVTHSREAAAIADRVLVLDAAGLRPAPA